VVLSGRAYAFTDGPCTASIYSAAGELCGRLTFPGCSANPRFGTDGTAIAAFDPAGVALWMGLLR